MFCSHHRVESSEGIEGRTHFRSLNSSRFLFLTIRVMAGAVSRSTQHTANQPFYDPFSFFFFYFVYFSFYLAVVNLCVSFLDANYLFFSSSYSYRNASSRDCDKTARTFSASVRTSCHTRTRLVYKHLPRYHVDQKHLGRPHK